MGNSQDVLSSSVDPPSRNSESQSATCKTATLQENTEVAASRETRRIVEEPQVHEQNIVVARASAVEIIDTLSPTTHVLQTLTTSDVEDKSTEKVTASASEFESVLDRAGPSKSALYRETVMLSDAANIKVQIQDSPKRTLRKKRQGQTRLKQHRALTVDNILKVLKGVSWKTLSHGRYLLGGVLQLLSSQKARIKRQNSTEEARKQSGVEFFLQNHPYASWRLLITGLEWEREHVIAKNLHHYAEKLTDPTLTLENVSKVTATVNEDTLANVLWVPESKRKEYKQQSSTTVDYRKKLVDYFLKYSPYASWSDVSSSLYWKEQHEAVKAAKLFIKRTSEPTLTLQNLTTLLENVERDWYGIVIHLNIPRSKRDEIEQLYTNVHQRSLASWKVYMTEHPQPNWKEVSRALYWRDHLNEVEIVHKKYLKGTAENRRQFEEAMKNGRIRAWLCKLLSYGPAGAGKSTIKDMLMGNQPDKQRNSTPLATRPATVCRVNLDDIKWTTLSSLDDRKKFLAKALACNNPDLVRHLLESQSPEDTADTTVEEVTPTNAQIDDIQVKSIEKQPSAKSVTPLASDKQDSPSSSDSESVYSEESIESQADEILQFISTDQELIRLMGDVSTHVTPRLAFKILQIIDSGGQSQFHEILPIFLRRLHFYMFVFRLCDDLDSRPEIEYFVENKPVGPSIKSAQTIEQLLQHCARTMHTHKSSAISTDVSPQIFVIGSHLDKEEESKENREQKNDRILKLLMPTLGKQIVYHNVRTKEVIFPINAKNPGPEEEAIIEQIREKLMDESSIPVAEIPSQWFALEILLQEMAQHLKRGVLSRQECIDVAVDKLHFEDDAQFDAAIQYLDDLSVLFHYPHTLPGIIFADPQVLLDKVTEIVHAAFQQSNSTCKGDDWRKFYEFALVTAEFLSKPEFSKHYITGLFEVKDLILLFEKLLIFARFSDNHLFVPALLRDLNTDEVNMYRHSSSTVPSLAVHFPDGAPRKGVFCSLLSWLVSRDNHPQWTILNDAVKSPKCLHRNCVQLYITDTGIVTLIDVYTHFEVHIDIPDEDADDFCPVVFPAIRESIFKGLHKATLNLGYYDDRPKPALVCPCGNGDSHVATANLDIGRSICSLNYRLIKLSCHQLLWLDRKHEGNHSEVIKPGEITEPDRLFNDLALGICDKYMEIGRELGLKAEVLTNELETGISITLTGSRKAFHMLKLWQNSTTNEEFTYATLATALRKHGFTRIAKKYCFTIV